MPRFMLDTDICSYIMRQSHAVVLERLNAVELGDVSISVVTKAELLFGAKVSPRPQRDAGALKDFLGAATVLDFPEAAADHYADIRAALQARGRPIGANDLFLAAHARCLGLTLVTNNTREFARVPGLALDNWTRRRAP